MLNLISKKYFSRIVPLMMVFVLLFFGLILVYTQKRGVFAQEEEITICVEMVDLDLPYIRVLDENKYPLLENEMEVPIGQSTDEIEEIAGDILEQLSDLINAAQIEAEKAEEMSSLMAQCGQAPFDCEPHCVLGEKYLCEGPKWKCGTSCGGSGWEKCGGCSGSSGCAELGLPEVCCCKYCQDCEPASCTGAACPPGIARFVARNPDGPIIDSAKKISYAYGQIDDWFVHRFLPATWIKKVQYGGWAKVEDIISISGNNWECPPPKGHLCSAQDLNTEQKSKDLCGWLSDNNRDAWEKLCITPISFATTGSESIPGKLDKSRPRLRECGLAIAEQELLLGPTAEIGCEDILLATIPISSYLDVGDPTDLCYHVDNNPTRFCKSCHGQFYCEAENKGYCAEDYFCCH